MNEHDPWEAQLPFYVANTLSRQEHQSVEEHLAACASCRSALAEWQALAAAVHDEAEARAAALPPLSPVVRANLVRPPTLPEALHSLAILVWSQRMVAVQSGLIPAALLVLLVGLVATAGLPERVPLALPLLALVPMVAALCVAFLYGSEADPAYEIVSAAPTEPATLLFARLTLVLMGVSLVAGLGSLLLSHLTSTALLSLVGVWLGPLLLLSALATLLTLLWRPLAAAALTMGLWLGLLLLLDYELRGAALVRLSLAPLLDPGPGLFLVQLVLAALLWGVGGLLLTRDWLPEQRWGREG